MYPLFNFIQTRGLTPVHNPPGNSALSTAFTLQLNQWHASRSGEFVSEDSVHKNRELSIAKTTPETIITFCEIKLESLAAFGLLSSDIAACWLQWH